MPKAFIHRSPTYKMMIKMSVTDRKITPKVVEDYKKKNPELPRRELRRLIRLELKIQPKTSEDRNLDRYLRKLFDIERCLLEKIKSLQNKVSNLEQYEWVVSYLRLSELLEDEEDYQLLYDLLEKLEMKQQAKAWKEEIEFQAEISKENPTPELNSEEKDRLKKKMK